MNNEDEDLGVASFKSPVEKDATPVVKTYFIDFGFNENIAAKTNDDISKIFDKAKAIEPPYDLCQLFALYDMSGSLRTNVDIYEQNVDGGDYVLKPIIDLSRGDVKTVIARAIISQKLRDKLRAESVDSLVGRLTKTARSLMRKADDTDDTTSTSDSDLAEALAISEEFGYTEEDIDKAIETIRALMIAEYDSIQAFLKYCSQTESFKSLRKQRRRDLEITGNSYWEILRNSSGTPSEIRYMPAQTIRLTELGPEVPVKQVVRLDPLNNVSVERKRKFRQFIQVVGQKKIYFKEFGDPRVISSVTGKSYADEAKLRSEEKDNADKNPSLVATELYHDRIKSAVSPYGIPRWISELLAVLGNRYAEEINLAFFENKSIPPMAILVSGGKLAKGDVDKLRDFIKNEIRGKRNFHKILILEAAASNPLGITNGKVTIEIKPLQHYVPDDGQFMKYMERNDDGIGSVFRNPRIARANTQDFNRATADAAMQIADNQVYGPMREEFDWFMNSVLFPAMDVRFYEFKTLAPTNTNKEEMAAFVDKAAARGILTIRELRELLEAVFQTTFTTPDVQDELDIPLELLRMKSRNTAAQAGGDDPDLNGILPPSKSPQKDPTAESQEQMDVSKSIVGVADVLAVIEVNARKKAASMASGVFAERNASSSESEL